MSTHRRRASSSGGGAGLGPCPEQHVYVDILFLDNSSMTLHVPILIQESELTALICKKLGFSTPAREGYYFGLVESLSGSQTLDRPLAKTEEVGVLAWQWQQQEEVPSKLVFVCKLFFDTVLRSSCKVVLHYLYIQAVHHVVTGLYPVPPAVAVRLACLQFRVKFGDVCGTTIRPEFLGNRVVEFIPGSLLRTRKPSEWSKAMQALLTRENTTLGGIGEDAARQEYLGIVEAHPFYGSTLFRVVRDPQTSTARDAFLAVNRTGIQVFSMPPSPLLETQGRDGDTNDDDVKHVVAGPELAYTLVQMLRWGYVPGTLFYVSLKIQTKEEEELERNGREPADQRPPQQECVNFGTQHGSWICDTVTLYAYGYLTEQDQQEQAVLVDQQQP